MLPAFIVPETTARASANGPVLDLGIHFGGPMHVTLGITSIIEQESLDVAILGSADGTEFDPTPLASFPQKFYCGSYGLTLDLTAKPEVKYLRAKWTVARWGKGDSKPLFAFFVFARPN